MAPPGGLTLGPMTQTPPPPGGSGFVVLDFELRGRPPLGHAGDLDEALGVLAAVQEQFYDQLDANGEGGFRAELALAIAPVDATGAMGPAIYWAIINGMRPSER